MGDDIGGVKKMGASNRHSVAQVLSASTLMMLVATSHCMMSTTTTTTAGNSSTASSAWCDGHIVDDQCLLIAQAYGGGEHLEYLNLDVMDRMLVEYDDSGETSSRRVLVDNGGQPKIHINDAVNNHGQLCQNSIGRYTCQNKPNNGFVPQCPAKVMYNRVCPL